MSSSQQIDSLLASKAIQNSVRSAAVCQKIKVADLAVQTYLHLPRFWPEQLTDYATVESEVDRLAHITRRIYEESKWLRNQGHFPSTLSDNYFSLAEVEGEDVDFMISKLHYLRSRRKGSINLGLIYKPRNQVVGVITVSNFDLRHLQIDPLSPSNVKVFSRIFTLDTLPKHTTSFFISRAFKWLGSNAPATKLILTYLNPNLGYTGTIYKATNWIEYAREHNVRYAYFNKNYVTDRFLLDRFGTARRDDLRALRVKNLEFSKIELRPLRILAYPLRIRHLDEPIQDVNVMRQ